MTASLLSGREARLVTQGCCRTWMAVGRWLGSMCNIFCTKSWGKGRGEGRGGGVSDYAPSFTQPCAVCCTLAWSEMCAQFPEDRSSFPVPIRLRILSGGSWSLLAYGVRLNRGEREEDITPLPSAHGCYPALTLPPLPHKHCICKHCFSPFIYPASIVYASTPRLHMSMAASYPCFFRTWVEGSGVEGQ